MVRRWGEVDERVGFQRLLVLETITVMDQGLACDIHIHESLHLLSINASPEMAN